MMKLFAFSLLVAAAEAFAPTTARHSADVALFAGSRKPFITGNWKLNPRTKQEAVDLATGIASAITDDSPCDVALFVPYVFLESIQNAVDGKLIVGAEMVTPEEEGAFTGGVSPRMLKSMGIKWALAGHSERRTINGETNKNINKQCLKLIENDMNVVLCVGESFEEYEKGLVGSVCQLQLKEGLAGVSAADMTKVTIAYEPVWAIGTGMVATPAIAQSVHATCREILANLYNQDVADATRILYGGSVGPDSVDGLMDEEDIDGALVGGASLSMEKFSRIINFQPLAKEGKEGEEAKEGKRTRVKKFVKNLVSGLKS